MVGPCSLEVCSLGFFGNCLCG